MIESGDNLNLSGVSTIIVDHSRENGDEIQESPMDVVDSECPTVCSPSETRNINSTRRVRNTTSGRENLRRSERMERRQRIFENQPMENPRVPSLVSMSEFPALERNS
ncbi:unnamed protein product [Allacma fusca]|uniref:Uncharacterized protein n=1 Tax=Allacma fusca TaxID=39272 RepID=A0A8J2KMM1_9HEXA|nr:unnamed protein product [Allacma fusca]